MAFTALHHSSGGHGGLGASSDALYKEPRENERVYYFPQGHMEQLEESTHQGLDQQMTSFDLPSKILCKVVHVQLWAEPETDEVYAHITLLPEQDQSEVTSPDPPLPEPQRGENGELRVGVRRPMRQLSNMPSSVISSHSMLEVLATASYALATGTLFSVSYKPRKSRSEFIVGVNKYLEARNHKFSVGMRFKMRFEGEEVLERRFSGTIVGVEDNTSFGWSNSEWRSLKVHWDETASILRPERVSPWELEPFVEATPSNSQAARRIKRARSPVLPSPSLDLSLSVIGMADLPTPLLEESISSMTPTPDLSLSVIGMAALPTAALPTPSTTPLLEDSISSESVCSN